MTPFVAFNGKDCSGCKHLNERGYCEFTACIIPCTVTGYIPETRKTNADRIRAMSDEELAAEFAKIEGDPNNGATIGFWLDWLKKEAE